MSSSLGNGKYLAARSPAGGPARVLLIVERPLITDLIRLTLNPRLSIRQPIEAAANPLPREETTPPVTKINLVGMNI